MTRDNSQPLVMIKLGGSLLTDKDNESTANHLQVRRSLKQIRALVKAGSGRLILGHGVGSFAHIPAAKYQTARGIINKESRLGAGITKERVLAIHQLVLTAGLKLGLPLFSLSPGSFLSREEGSAKTYLTPLLNCLKFKLLPLLYGDVITDNLQGFGIYSTEKSFEIVAQALSRLGFEKIKLIHLGITKGVYDKAGKTILRLTRDNYAQYFEAVGESQSIDVTGGMKLKVETALRMAEFGVETYIVDGQTVDLVALLEGRTKRNEYTLITR